MPCTLQPWEEEFEEKEDNKRKFGLRMDDQRLTEEVACRAARFIKTQGLLKKAPPLVQKWWALHEEWDRKQGR